MTTTTTINLKQVKATLARLKMRIFCTFSVEVQTRWCFTRHVIVSNFESGVSKECPRSFSKDHRFSQKNFNRFESQEKNKMTFDRDHKMSVLNID